MAVSSAHKGGKGNSAGCLGLMELVAVQKVAQGFSQPGFLNQIPGLCFFQSSQGAEK